jgi:hypothetical protein
MRRFLALACSILGIVACSSATTGSPDGGAPSGDGGPSDGTLQQLCVDTINGYRKTLNLPPYARWTDGEQCADRQAVLDGMSNKPHGAFGQCMESAQNECPSWPSADPKKSLVDCLAMMWAEGPGTDFGTHGHYINMTSVKYTKVACGFETTSAGKWWSVQNFK